MQHKQYKPWTAEEDQALIAFAAETKDPQWHSAFGKQHGRSANAVKMHFEKLGRSQADSPGKAVVRRSAFTAYDEYAIYPAAAKPLLVGRLGWLHGRGSCERLLGMPVVAACRMVVIDRRHVSHRLLRVLCGRFFLWLSPRRVRL